MGPCKRASHSPPDPLDKCPTTGWRTPTTTYLPSSSWRKRTVPFLICNPLISGRSPTFSFVGGSTLCSAQLFPHFLPQKTWHTELLWPETSYRAVTFPRTVREGSQEADDPFLTGAIVPPKFKWRLFFLLHILLSFSSFLLSNFGKEEEGKEIQKWRKKY